MKYYYIKDNVDKEEEINLEQIQKDNNEKMSKLTDSKISDDYVVYNIATVSDKEINARIYPHDKVLKTVEDKLWVKPFFKPFLKNHDEYSEPVGRIIDSFYYLHSTKQIICQSGEEEIPQDVIDAFENKKMFEDGTGSVILKIKTDKETFDKIQSGLYITTSQGSATDSRTCSICKKPISECDHYPREVYDGQKCLIITGNLFPIENSIVNSPANDTSTLLIYDKINKKVIDKITDSKEPIIKIKDDAQKMMEETLKKYADLIKNNQAKKIKDFFGESEKIEQIINLFSLEDTEKLIIISDAFLELGEIKITDKITELNAVITDKETEITKLKDQVSELEIKLIDLETPVTKDGETTTPEQTEQPIVTETPQVPETPEVPEEPKVPEVPKTTKDNEEIENKIKDEKEKEEDNAKNKNVITENFTTQKIQKKNEEVKDFVTNLLNNQKNVMDTF